MIGRFAVGEVEVEYMIIEYDMIQFQFYYLDDNSSYGETLYGQRYELYDGNASNITLDDYHSLDVTTLKNMMEDEALQFLLENKYEPILESINKETVLW